MAVSSAGSSTTSSIDVASIVEQLMKVENKPLDALTSKIDQQKLIISDLGIIKSKIAIFQDAVKEFENPLSFNTVIANSSNTKVLTASGSNGALLGNYSIDVNAVASADSYNISGYDSVNAEVYVEEFTLKIGKVGSEDLEEFVWEPSGSTTLTSLVNWINSLDAEVYARVVQTTGDSDFALQIFGTKTGEDNAVTFSGLFTDVGLETEIDPEGDDIHTIRSGDAQFTVNEVAFERSSNTITGVIDGVTLNLISPSATDESEVVNVTRGADNSEAVIKKLIDSYNDLVETYKSMTANAMNSDKPGTFANNPMMLSFINDIKSRFATGAKYGEDMQTSVSLTSMGIEMKRDGTLTFNALSYFDAKTNGLQDTLANGVKIGYVSSNNNLQAYLRNLIGFTGNTGRLATIIEAENSQVNELNNRKLELQDRLAGIQNNLINQYSALNALLYQLSQTNNALTSALDAISNNSKN